MIKLSSCPTCKKAFYSYNKGGGRGYTKHCSSKCFYISNRGKIPWNKGKPIGFIPKFAFKKGCTPWNKGLKKDR